MQTMDNLAGMNVEIKYYTIAYDARGIARDPCI